MNIEQAQKKIKTVYELKIGLKIEVKYCKEKRPWQVCTYSWMPLWQEK